MYYRVLYGDCWKEHIPNGVNNVYLCVLLLQKKGKASGYIMFAAEYRKDIMNQHKDLSFGEISKIVGQKVRKQYSLTVL